MLSSHNGFLPNVYNKIWKTILKQEVIFTRTIKL